jgi:mRNA-degrading endonuclease toxin of MazEF toxin-antitoxin module
VTRGEVWYTRTPLGQQLRPVVILSNDSYNRSTRRAPLVALITDVEHDPADPYVITLTDIDPLPGRSVLVGSLAPIRRQWFTEAPLGMLTGATLTRVEAAARDLFDL